MKNKDAKADARRMVERLDRILRRRGRGGISAVNRLMGRGSGWWHQRLTAGDLKVWQLMKILRFLDKDPVLFLREAVGAEDGLELDRPPGPVPGLVRKARDRFRLEGSNSGTVGEDTLKTLDTMRYEQPAQAVEQASALVDYCPRELLPRLLGIAGSAWRLAMDLDRAEHAIHAAIRMCQSLEDHRGVGEMLQRLGYVLATSWRSEARSTSPCPWRGRPSISTSSARKRWGSARPW